MAGAWLFGFCRRLPLGGDRRLPGFVGRLAHGRGPELEELLAGQVCGIVRLRDRGWAA
ncbi:hypothetical protein ACFWAN_03995 [Streptomyces mirabilis]|uniref:hypothetical protein n=1 Tax=Streptomyces mirabilis TaxID=68239 RepID=UPI00365FE0E6